jgi:SAM-dependent methyltransferase
MGESLAKPDYGSWVSKRLVYVPVSASLVFAASAVFFPVLVIPAALLFVVFAYFGYARYEFAAQGGNLEDRIRELVLVHLDWSGEGKALDIGCGNAPLSIKLAQKYPKAHVVGIDYWGGGWEYSKSKCERNAEIEGVSDRAVFQKASASSLPFDDQCFDAVVSNLVFHEVGDARDKREVVREALRVVKRGGKFAFQDLFLMKRVYGNIDDLISEIRSWGVRRVEFVRTGEASFIPTALKLPFMTGTMGIIAGEK